MSRVMSYQLDSTGSSLVKVRKAQHMHFNLLESLAVWHAYSSQIICTTCMLASSFSIAFVLRSIWHSAPSCSWDGVGSGVGVNLSEKEFAQSPLRA